MWEAVQKEEQEKYR